MADGMRIAVKVSEVTERECDEIQDVKTKLSLGSMLSMGRGMGRTKCLRIRLPGNELRLLALDFVGLWAAFFTKREFHQ